MTDDFSDAPISIGEIRGYKTGEVNAWTPRDILIRALRRIDSGEVVDCDAMVISYRYKEEGEGVLAYITSSPDLDISRGIVSRTLHLLNA